MDKLPPPPAGYDSWLAVYREHQQYCDNPGPWKQPVWFENRTIGHRPPQIKEYAFRELLATNEQQAADLAQARQRLAEMDRKYAGAVRDNDALRKENQSKGNEISALKRQLARAKDELNMATELGNELNNKCFDETIRADVAERELKAARQSRADYEKGWLEIKAENDQLRRQQLAQQQLRQQNEGMKAYIGVTVEFYSITTGMVTVHTKMGDMIGAGMIYMYGPISQAEWDTKQQLAQQQPPQSPE